MYCPMLLAPLGPNPGSVTMNFRMLVGLWAYAQARPVPKTLYKAAPAPVIAAIFINFRLVIMLPSFSQEGIRMILRICDRYNDFPPYCDEVHNIERIIHS